MKLSKQHHLLHLWLMLLLVSAIETSQDVPGLNCTFDSLATVTCTWTPDSSLVDEHCSITGTVKGDDIKATCYLPTGNVSRSCELILGKSKKELAMTVGHRMKLVVSCLTGINKTTEDKVVEIPDYVPYYNLLLSPPIALKISSSSDGYYNLTWSCEHSHYLANKRKYEVRYKPTQHKHWMDTLFIEQEQRWVTIQKLLPDTEYEVQVRVNQMKFRSSRWSQWSHAIVWITPKADFMASENNEEGKVLHVLVPCLSVGAVITLAVTGFYASKWFKRILYLHIPDPAKFFNHASYEHGGNFQEWLASPFAPSFFTSTEVLPEISPVEIAPKKFISKELFFPTGPQETSGNSMSSFTNQGYFFFHYPNFLKIDPCQIYFTYEPFSNESSSSENSPSYGALHSSGAKDVLPLCSAEVDMAHTAGGSMGVQNCSLHDDPQNMPADLSHLLLMSPPLVLAGNSARGMQVKAANMEERKNTLESSHLLFTHPMATLDQQRTEGRADGITESEGKRHLQPFTSHMMDDDGIKPLVPSSEQALNCCFQPPSLNLVNRDYLTLNELQGQYGCHSV